MELIVAHTAGFCFGVDKAVNAAYSQLNNENRPIYSLGKIIHNPQVIAQLESGGVKVVDRVEELPDDGGTVIIRAHGVSPDVYKTLETKHLQVVDTTCPYVRKIHMLVKEKYTEGYQIIIVGDKKHPEVVGINGCCDYSAYVVNSPEDISQLQEGHNKVCVVAQTTITKEKWDMMNTLLKKKFDNLINFDTICSATSNRQKEAAEIAKKVELMLVIGGNESSNTQKLYEICRKYCTNTIKIETPGELTPVNIQQYQKIGITAGASTPEWIIREVMNKMSELNTHDNELSFQEALESSLVTLRSGEVVKGTIMGFNNSEVYVDLGFKSEGVIPMEEFTDDPDFNMDETIKIGAEVEAIVKKVDDREGIVQLSKKQLDAAKHYQKLEAAFENKTPVKAKVVEAVNGGVVATAGGVRIFIPASQVSDRYVKDLKEFAKQNIEVRIIEFNKQKRKIVGSARVLLEEQKAAKMDTFWSTAEIGKVYQGVVKSIMDFGAFVDLGGVDGLIHISELSWSKIKHPSAILKVGEKVSVKILDLDKEKGRISLGYRKPEDNPWYNADEKYQVGAVIKGKVVRLVPFGAFVEIAEGVDGLVHISQISNVRIAKPGDVLEIGQEVEAKITDVNVEAKKIGLSIKEVRAIDPVRSSEETAVEGEETEPSEHKEEMNISIGDMIKE